MHLSFFCFKLFFVYFIFLKDLQLFFNKVSLKTLLFLCARKSHKKIHVCRKWRRILLLISITIIIVITKSYDTHFERTIARLQVMIVYEVK